MPSDARTALGVLRYRSEEAVTVIESTRAGRTAAECADAGGAIPIVGDVAETLMALRRDRAPAA
jgi:hypothetical protein